MVKAFTPADALYCLEELLLVTGKLLGEEISPRTVRLYATQALINRPCKDGRSCKSISLWTACNGSSI